MAEIDADQAKPEGRQINLNTGLNISQLVLLVGLVVWSVTVKNTVDYHADLIRATQVELKEHRTELAAIRASRADVDIRNAERLSGIEASLREIRNLLSDRRAPP